MPAQIQALRRPKRAPSSAAHAMGIARNTLSSHSAAKSEVATAVSHGWNIARRSG